MCFICIFFEFLINFKQWKHGFDSFNSPKLFTRITIKSTGLLIIHFLIAATSACKEPYIGELYPLS